MPLIFQVLNAPGEPSDGALPLLLNKRGGPQFAVWGIAGGYRKDTGPDTHATAIVAPLSQDTRRDADSSVTRLRLSVENIYVHELHHQSLPRVVMDDTDQRLFEHRNLRAHV
jgi:hypothetical protein